MDFLRHIFKSRARKPTQVTSVPIQEESNCLSRLPLELLREITSCLAPSSTAALALCSKSLLRKLGTANFEALKDSWKVNSWHMITPLTPQQLERCDFLLMLERDVSGVFCYFCGKIHSPNKWPHWPYGEDYCSASMEVDTDSIYGYAGFNYARIRMAMKNHRLGFDNSDVINKLSRTVTRYWPVTHQHQVTSRIIRDSFHVRTQHWIPLESTQPFRLPTEHHMLSICDHITYCPDFQLPLEGLLKCKLTHYNNKFDHKHGCVGCQGLRQCIKCLTEYQIDIKDLGTQQPPALVVTVWQEFGNMVFPLDPVFRSHFVPWDLGMYFQLGSIKDTFEEGQGFIFDAGFTDKRREALRQRSKLHRSVFS